jgi:hypothetical protein
MCKAPKPPAPKEPKKPQFLRNRYLDEYVGQASAVKSLKTGRGTLRIPLGGPSPISTAPQPASSSPVQPVAPRPSGRNQPINPNEPRRDTR